MLMSNKLYFDNVADQWDNMRKSFFGNIVREKAFEAAKLETNKIAADVGAGTGFICEGLLEKGLKKVIAVDHSNEMIGEMKKKFSEFNNIEYVCAEGNHIPVDNSTFDYVFANMYLHHSDSPQEAINEMTRILKTGGKLVITDLDKHDFEFLRVEQFDKWLGFDRDDIKNLFEKAGLNNVNVDCVGGNCCSDSNCGCSSASISIFVAVGEKK